MDNVKAKLIELVPDIVVNPHAQLIGHDRKVTYFKECRPITLADVLRAIEEQQEFFWTRKADAYEITGGAARIIVEWNLTTDYDHQTDEVKTFIGTLLGVTN